MTKSGKNIKHFIKFLPKLNNITLVKRLGDNWQRVVLDDITENGERIKFLPLLSTYDQSKSITLYGRKFYCEACVDRERNDTLFIFHVFDAAPGGPPKSLKEIDGPWGDFCCQGGHVERTIPLPPQLLASESQKACAEFIHPSAQLIDTFERHIRHIEIDLFDIAATKRLLHCNLLPSKYLESARRKTLLLNYSFSAITALLAVLLLWLSLWASNRRIYLKTNNLIYFTCSSIVYFLF